MQNQIFKFLGCRPITIRTRTKPKLKKGCPLKNVVKESLVNGMVGGQYVNAVNNAQERGGGERDFTPQPRKWGYRLPGTPLVEHKGKRYLEMHVLRSLETRYFSGEMDVTEQIQEYLPEKIDTPVVWRDYDLENIKEVRMNGEVHVF